MDRDTIRDAVEAGFYDAEIGSGPDVIGPITDRVMDALQGKQRPLPWPLNEEKEGQGV